MTGRTAAVALYDECPLWAGCRPRSIYLQRLLTSDTTDHLSSTRLKAGNCLTHQGAVPKANVRQQRPERVLLGAVRPAYCER